MARPPRPDFSNLPVHVVNRAARRAQLFFDDYDYAAFEKILLEAIRRIPIRILAYCVMPNHWHFVLWPRSTEELSAFMKWLTQVHAARWRQARGTVGDGAVYQGRFKAFPVATDQYLLSVLRYVERNALRANLVARAEDWLWGSAWQRTHQNQDGILTPSPLQLRSDWLDWVNQPQSTAELEALRGCVEHSRPFGPEDWVRQTAKALDLEHTLEDPSTFEWRPDDVPPVS